MNQEDDVKRLQKARNDANNANTIYNAANIAEKSGHPLAAGIGKGVKMADKLTGGKSTQKLGKAMTTLNKASGLKGKAMQAVSNKLGESGLGNRISSAKNKKNSAPIANNTSIGKPKSTQQDSKKNQGTINNKNINDSSTMRDVQDQASDGGDASFKVDFKILYRGLIVCAACLPVLIFGNLFMSASQIYIKSIGLGNADILGTDAADKKIDKKIDDEEDLNTNPTDEETDDSTNTLGQLDFEINIDADSKNIRDSKLKQSNIVQIAIFKRRKYNEATLEQLEDFYPSVGSLSEKYDEDLVYDFFFKMYNIYTTYQNEYNVNLDMPLIMSTLMMQSEDMNEIFDSNLTKEEKSNKRISKLRMKSLYSYDTDLSSYRLSPDNSEHDMELLAQNMLSVDENGNYKYDEEKYKEFLKEFLERKYFIEDTGSSSNFLTGSGNIGFTNSYSDGKATTTSIYEVSGEPDPSLAINYWSYLDSSDFVYPKDDSTGKSLGAWPKNYKKIPAQLNNPKTYNGGFIWPTTPVGGTYSYVYEHLGIDIMANFGEPIYSPVDAILVYSEWGHTVNRGSDETAYSVTLELETPIKFAGVNIGHIFLTHMSGIRYRCEWGNCNRKVKKGELLGFVGNAAGTSLSGGWAPHLHMTYYPYNNYGGGLYTKNMEKLYNITSGTKRKAGG